MQETKSQPPAEVAKELVRNTRFINDDLVGRIAIAIQTAVTNNTALIKEAVEALRAPYLIQASDAYRYEAIEAALAAIDCVTRGTQ